MKDQGQDAASTATALRRAFDASFAAAPSQDIRPEEEFLLLGIAEHIFAVRLQDVTGLHADRKITPLPSPLPALYEPVPKPSRAALGAPGGCPQGRRGECSGSARSERDEAGCRPPPQPEGTMPAGRSAASAPLIHEPHGPAGSSLSVSPGAIRETNRNLRSIPADVVAARGGFGTGSCGLAALSGNLIPVYSLSALLGLPLGERSTWLLLSGQQEALGFAFERFLGHIRIPSQDIAQVPEGQTQLPCISRLVPAGGGMVPVLDLPSLIEDIRHQAISVGLTFTRGDRLLPPVPPTWCPSKTRAPRPAQER